MENEKSGGFVDEGYINSVRDMLEDAEPGDFTPLGAAIPTGARDGETVAMVVTGVARNGILQHPHAAEMAVAREKKQGRIKMLIMGGKHKEEE